MGKDKKITIDQQITITILEVKHNQICFAIEAPSFISISKEKKSKKQKNNLLEKITLED